MNVSKFFAVIMMAICSVFVFSSDVVAADGKAGKRVWNPGDIESISSHLKKGNEVCLGSKTFHSCHVYNPLSREISVSRVNRPVGIGKNTKELVSFQVDSSGNIVYASSGRAVTTSSNHIVENGNGWSYLASGLSGAVASTPGAISGVLSARELRCPECADNTTINNTTSATGGSNTNSNVAQGGLGGAGGLGGNAVNTNTNTAQGGAGGLGGNATATGGAGGNAHATGGNANATGGNTDLNVNTRVDVRLPCTSGCQ